MPFSARPPLHSDEAATARARRVLIASCAAAAAALTAAVALLLPQDADTPLPAAADPIVFPTVPQSADLPSVPDPISESVTIPGSAGPTTHVATTRPQSRRPTPPPATRTVSPTPTPDLRAGETVGLEVQRQAGFRVRHRNFLGRVDRISAASRAADRADTRFVVRRGLGRASCVSLEAVNFPGFFLRHRDFVIHLEKRDNSQLFQQDATFCPQRTGDAVVLMSINFPGQGISLRGDDTLHLDDDGITAFVVRSPL
jgi:hypothetical protein